MYNDFELKDLMKRPALFPSRALLGTHIDLEIAQSTPGVGKGLLPQDLYAKGYRVRVLTFGYDSAVPGNSR